MQSSARLPEPFPCDHPAEASLEIGSIACGVEPIVRDAVRVRVSDFDQVAARAKVAIR